MCSKRAADAQTLIRLFDELFSVTEKTLLRGGANEPLYEPATLDAPATIWFRHDYAASALHEVAHWCIAGKHRRSQTDYGYWYAPDGRDCEQQQKFMQVEVRPQALESLFAEAAGLEFRVSLDNLDGRSDPNAEQQFSAAVDAQRRKFRSAGLPPRAERFVNALHSQPWGQRPDAKDPGQKPGQSDSTCTC